jgi:hypothetical protein
VVIIIILSGFMAWAMKEKAFAQQQQMIANEQKTEANKQREQAEDEKNNALKANKRAEQERIRAEENATKALESKKISDAARKLSERMRTLAEEKGLLAQQETEKAQLEKLRANKQREIAVMASDSAKTLSLLATAQTMAFKAQQNYSNKQINLIAAWYANYFNSNYNGPVRDAAVYEGLRFALETNGYNNVVYTSNKAITNMSLNNDQSMALFHNNGDYKNLETNNFTEKSNLNFAYPFPVNRAIIVPDYVISSYENGGIYLWNVNTGQSQILSGHTDFVSDALRIDDYLITASRDKTIKIWNLKQLELGAIKTLTTEYRVNVLSKNGKIVYAGLFNGTLVAFNVYEPQIDEISKLSHSITSLAFNSNIHGLIAGTSFGKVYLFDTENNNKQIHEISNNETFIESIATDTNANLLAIATSDKIIQIFDLLDLQKKPIRISNHNQNTQKMLFNAKGLLLVLCTDNSVRIWETDCQPYADLVKAKIHQKPTEKEWKQLVGNTITCPN